MTDLFQWAADAPLRSILRRLKANPKIYRRRAILARAALLQAENEARREGRGYEQ